MESMDFRAPDAKAANGPLHKIGVISDTHGTIRPEVIKRLAPVELILHGGDIAGQKALDQLKQIANVVAVRGNCDKEWASDIPQEVSLELYGKRIYMIHNKKQISKKANDADIIIYGHSHKYEEKKADGKFYLNPGSCGPRRFGAPLTMAILEFDSERGVFRAEKIELAADPAGRPRPDFSARDPHRTAETVIRDLKRGRTVDQIVKAHGFDYALTEQICQIYYTHPGIDVQGVLNRMEIAGL